MNISCPQCGFSRNVPPDRLPHGSATATCPKCGCKFRIAAPNQSPKGNMRPKPDSSQEEEEDIRVVASRAYAAEAERFEREQRNGEGRRHLERARNPWDGAPAPDGWITAFYQTILRVMFSASTFFAGLKLQCIQWRPLLFFMLICVIQACLERLWSELFIFMLSSVAVTDPQLENMLRMLSPRNDFALNLLIRCGMMALQLYVLSFIMYLVYRILVPQRVTYALVFQIMAYSAAPAILCLVPIIGSIAGWIWSLACLLVGCKAALDLDWPRVLCGFIPLILLFAPVFLQIMAIMKQ